MLFTSVKRRLNKLKNQTELIKMVCGSGERYNLLCNVIPQKQADLFYCGIILFYWLLSMI